MTSFYRHLGASIKYALSAIAGVGTVVLVGGIFFLALAIYRTPLCGSRTGPKSVADAIRISSDHLRAEGASRLKQFGLDSSITDLSEPLQHDPPPCSSPSKYHVGRTDELGGYSVAWSESVRGACKQCWTVFTVSVDVGKCGGASVEGVGRRDFSYDPQADATKRYLCPPKSQSPKETPQR